VKLDLVFRQSDYRLVELSHKGLVLNHDIDRTQSGEGKAAGSPRRPVVSFAAALEHPSRRVDADSLAGHARNGERNPPPVRGNKVTLALTGLSAPAAVFVSSAWGYARRAVPDAL
jgi:hypothetical protein